MGWLCMPPTPTLSDTFFFCPTSITLCEFRESVAGWFEWEAVFIRETRSARVCSSQTPAELVRGTALPTATSHTLPTVPSGSQLSSHFEEGYFPEPPWWSGPSSMPLTRSQPRCWLLALRAAWVLFLGEPLPCPQGMVGQFCEDRSPSPGPGGSRHTSFWTVGLLWQPVSCLGSGLVLKVSLSVLNVSHLFLPSELCVYPLLTLVGLASILAADFGRGLVGLFRGFPAAGCSQAWVAVGTRV